MGLRKFMDNIKPTFSKGGKLGFLESTFDAFETFLFVPNTTTSKGAHIRDCNDMKRTMIMVVAALMPAFLFGCYNTGIQVGLEGFTAFFYGLVRVLPMVCVSYIVGLGIEFGFAQARGHEVNEGFLVTGLLIPMIFPVSTPLWMVALSTAFAVVFGKEVFGGTGMNVFNPALLARAFVFFAYTPQMSGEKVWFAVDSVSGATALEQLSTTGAMSYSNLDAFLGFIPGCVGETSTLAILIGAAILLFTGIASWRTMLSVFAGGWLMGLLFNAVGANAYCEIPAWQHLIVGGFAFGAVFMATDPVTSAQTNAGKYIVGLMTGALAVMIRVVNPAYPEGMDLSTLAELEKCGAKYYDNGEEKALLEIMKSYDVDTIRIRVWNDPWSEAGESYGAGENDPKTSLEIAKRVTKAGFGVLLNLHYSDFWADPGKQFKPKAWESYGVKELEQAVYDFTLEMMHLYLENGINITMVQVGNELSNGLLWPEGKVPNYDNIAAFVNAGIRAVRKADEERLAGSIKGVCPQMEGLSKIPVMIHLDNGGNNALYREWFDNFTKRGEDFELIGLSYYPFWHGSLQMLNDNMNDIAKRYGKDLIVAEVSMGYTMDDYKDYEKLADEERKGYATKPALVEKIEYPMTVQGQYDFMEDFLNRISHIDDGKGKGFFYWEPAWIPVPGSGWATPASLKYIQDPGPCGNEWANQALFDYEGNALPTLKLIRDFKA